MKRRSHATPGMTARGFTGHSAGRERMPTLRPDLAIGGLAASAPIRGFEGLEADSGLVVVRLLHRLEGADAGGGHAPIVVGIKGIEHTHQYGAALLSQPITARQCVRRGRLSHAGHLLNFGLVRGTDLENWIGSECPGDGANAAHHGLVSAIGLAGAHAGAGLHGDLMTLRDVFLHPLGGNRDASLAGPRFLGTPMCVRYLPFPFSRMSASRTLHAVLGPAATRLVRSDVAYRSRTYRRAIGWSTCRRNMPHTGRYVWTAGSHTLGPPCSS